MNFESDLVLELLTFLSTQWFVSYSELEASTVVTYLTNLVVLFAQKFLSLSLSLAQTHTHARVLPHSLPSFADPIPSGSA